MKPLPHRYQVHLRGAPDGHAELNAHGLPTLAAAPPVEFDGPGDAWSPEHLLLAAVETCLLLTLRAVASASQLTFSSLDVDAIGFADRENGVLRFVDIVLDVRIGVPAGSDHDRVQRVLEKAKRECLVMATLATPVRMDPTIVEEPSPAAA